MYVLIYLSVILTSLFILKISVIIIVTQWIRYIMAHVHTRASIWINYLLSMSFSLNLKYRLCLRSSTHLFPGLGFAGLFFLYTPLVSCIIIFVDLFFGYFVRPFSLGPVETPPHHILLTVQSHHGLAVRIVGPWPAGPGSIPGGGSSTTELNGCFIFFHWKQWCWNDFFWGLTIPPPLFPLPGARDTVND